MKYWHPHLPFGQHISVSTLALRQHLYDIIKEHIFVTNKNIDQCYKLVHLQNNLISVCINWFKQHSINQSITSQNISLINFLDFFALKLLLITENSSILSGILPGNKKLSSRLEAVNDIGNLPDFKDICYLYNAKQ